MIKSDMITSRSETIELVFLQ